MKTIIRAIGLLSLIFIFTGCPQEPDTDYQAFQDASPDRVLYIANGSAWSFSALDCDSGEIYNDIQTFGRDSSGAAPGGMLIEDDVIYIVVSAQNSVESYNAETLDYLDRCDLQNGMNPLSIVPVGETGYAFVTGYATDDIVLIDLDNMEVVSGYLQVYAEVDISDDHCSEYAIPDPPDTNAAGDNKRRGTTDCAVIINGADSRLYVTNVRYDSSILLTDPLFSDNLAESESGNNVRADGNFRQGTMSIFSFNADALTARTPGSADITLVKEIDLDDLYRDGVDDISVTGSYFPGDGLNPQSILYKEGLLQIICTGTNGGAVREYTEDDYIPEGYAAGDEVPGSNPDDGIILALDPSVPDSPVYVTHLDIGGSPAGYDNSVDETDKIVYVAGVGGIHAYSYGGAAGDFGIIRDSANPVLAAGDSSFDYYSGLLFDGIGDNLYVAFFTESRLLTIPVTGTADTPVYGEPSDIRTGDGPGIMGLWER